MSMADVLDRDGLPLVLSGPWDQSEVNGLEAALAGKAASSHTHGIADLPVASQAEAVAGTATTKVMTPERVKEAIQATQLRERVVTTSVTTEATDQVVVLSGTNARTLTLNAAANVGQMVVARNEASVTTAVLTVTTPVGGAVKVPVREARTFVKTTAGWVAVSESRLDDEVMVIEAGSGVVVLQEGKRVVWVREQVVDVALTLPTAAEWIGRTVEVWHAKESGYFVEIDAVFDGVLANRQVLPGQGLILISDGESWRVVWHGRRRDLYEGVLTGMMESGDALTMSSLPGAGQEGLGTFVLTGSTARTLTLSDGTDDLLVNGRIVVAKNASTALLSVVGDIEGAVGATLVMSPGESMTLQWSASPETWRIIGRFMGPEPKFQVMLLDVVNNNGVANTLADLTELGFLVKPGLYRFRFVIHYDAAATTTGSRWTINGPTATKLSYRSVYGLTTTSETVNNGLGAYGLPAAANATSPATTGNVAIVEGIAFFSAEGTLVPRFASEVAGSAITALTGSCGELVRLQL